MEERPKELNEEPKTERVKPLIPAHAFVFIASFCLMVIELVAGRIMAPYLGSSIYTWTSVIGVILMGITAGNWVGGVIAERGAKWKTVGAMFFLAAFASVISFYTYQPIYWAVNGLQPTLAVASFLFAMTGFFPASFFLSMVTPMVITLRLDSLKKTGTTVGGIYAISAMASILGTFLTGYVLIALLSVRIIVLMVAAVLMLTGILALADKALVKGAPMLLFLALLWMGLLAPPFCRMETAYYCVRIHDIGSGAQGKALLLDHLVHSFVTPDPRFLAYDYEAIYSVATEYVSRNKSEKPLDALFIGGGGYVMPRFIEANYKIGDLTVVEIDPGVTRASQVYLGYLPDGPIHNVNMDARVYMNGMKDDKKYDIIFGDAFNDYSIPFHLTTKEFVTMVRKHLAPNGVYALNVIDSNRNGQVLGSFIDTLSQVFPSVEVAPLQSEWRNAGRNTFVIIAAEAPIDRKRWHDAATVAFEARMSPPIITPQDQVEMLFSAEDTKDFLGSHRHLSLTDDYVHVDNLIAPIFRDSF
ncbi:MAG TPA: fused MFS/spermidine synthase [Candidatus Eisenbacteria bacterium]|nr:fused MFS/spermidine synthase [Candidatus Eisenbacteria bacterium]